MEATVPGIRHRRATGYLPYRHTAEPAGAPPAGCLATITVDFDGPNTRRARDWIDGVFAASGTDRASPAAGLIAAHFHVSLDGIRVLNLAEWTSARAHREAAEAAAPRLRDAARRFPGVVGTAVRRFVPYRGITFAD
ncbi:hypothetical protein GCM10023322_10410 [Rugosimonospora acidiphila]|uniref:Antibiotic biosynthesis monooxygenase n=1 Tax=Rugosimonospora acidiphila TaxID=556531 RepID=A0ABP9RM05_9ACTN